jgi:hypothetical protein
MTLLLLFVIAVLALTQVRVTMRWHLVVTVLAAMTATLALLD